VFNLISTAVLVAILVESVISHPSEEKEPTVMKGMIFTSPIKSSRRNVREKWKTDLHFILGDFSEDRM
jgi:hypothetical protein